MKIACIKFLYDVVSSLHMHYFVGCSLRYVKVHLRFAASSCTHTELFQQALNNKSGLKAASTIYFNSNFILLHFLKIYILSGVVSCIGCFRLSLRLIGLALLLSIVQVLRGCLPGLVQGFSG